MIKKEFDLTQEELSAFSSHPFIQRTIYCNNAALAFGPVYLLWRGEGRLSLNVYWPVTVFAAFSFGLIGYGIAAVSSFLVWLGTIFILLCLLATLCCNLWLHFSWNKFPHTQNRHFFLALMGFLLIVALPPVCMNFGSYLYLYHF